MNYIDLVNHFWRVDEGTQFTGWETKLYFYLIKTANSLGWVNVFWHSDSRVSANVGMSVNTMKTSRNRLKQAGLIDFVSGGKGHGDKTRYQILAPVVLSKTESSEVVENAGGYQKIIPKLTPKVPTGDKPMGEGASGCQNLVPKVSPTLIPKLIPKVLAKPTPLNKLNETKPEITTTTILASEIKLPEKKKTVADRTLAYVDTNRQEALASIPENFTKEQLKADLLNSELCKMAAKNSEVLPDEYAGAVENFVETKFGLGKNKNWKDITCAREHFLYWIPYYKSSIVKKHGKRATQKTTSGRQIVEQAGNDESVVEQGADGVVRRVSGTGVQTFAG